MYPIVLHRPLRHASIVLVLLLTAPTIQSRTLECPPPDTARAVLPADSLPAPEDSLPAPADRVLGVVQKATVHLGDPLTVIVESSSTREEMKTLRLVLNELVMEGLEPTNAYFVSAGVNNRKRYCLTYTLDARVPNDQTRTHWARLVRGGSATWSASGWRGWPNHNLRVGLVTNEGAALAATAENTISFQAASTTRRWLSGLLGIGLAVVWIGVLLWKKVLRIDSSDPKSRYSLSKTVMAAWTLVILLCYLCLWVLTGEHNGLLDGTALILLGITAATLPVAKQIEKEQARALTASHEGTTFTPATSDGVWTDLTSGPASALEEPDIPKGPALSRYQMLIWNVLLMGIYCATTWRALDLPDFDPTLLAVLGISNGLYLGKKIVDPADTVVPDPVDPGDA